MKIIEENIGSSKISDIAIFYQIYLPKQGKQEENKQMGLHQTKMTLYSKGNHQQNKKKTHRLGEHIC